jgi:hypothetical protein
MVGFACTVHLRLRRLPPWHPGDHGGHVNDGIACLKTPYREVRPIVAPEDGPWTGMLTRLDSDDTCIMVDAESFPGSWRGWHSDQDGHVLTPIEVVRRADGHDIALPVCGERLDDFLTRRSHARTPITSGESVTILVSILRGIAEFGGDPAITGEWWLTDAGRPVLATDVSARSAVTASLELVEQLAECSVETGSPETARVIELISAGRVRDRDVRAVEDDLFAHSTPTPLATMITGSRGARELTSYDRARSGDAESSDRPTPTVELLARHIDADLAETFSRATTAVWRRLTRRSQSRTRRGAPWLVAAAAAGAVIVGGLLWPDGGGSPATADNPSTAASPTPTGGTTAEAGASSAGPSQAHATPDDTGATSADAPSKDDLAGIAESLLERRIECAGDEECIAGLTSRGGVHVSGVVDLDAAERETTLLDDFGGVAVVRVDPRDGNAPSQLVVIERRDDEWLLRDVYDAAQQP